jgi:hypothetical protein
LSFFFFFFFFRDASPISGREKEEKGMTSCNPGRAFIFPSDFWFLPRARGEKRRRKKKNPPKIYQRRKGRK